MSDYPYNDPRYQDEYQDPQYEEQVVSPNRGRVNSNAAGQQQQRTFSPTVKASKAQYGGQQPISATQRQTIQQPQTLTQRSAPVQQPAQQRVAQQITPGRQAAQRQTVQAPARQPVQQQAMQQRPVA